MCNSFFFILLFTLAHACHFSPYFSALYFATYLVYICSITTDSWYLGSAQCDFGPYPCFTHCFNTSAYTRLSTCGYDRIAFGTHCSKKFVTHIMHKLFTQQVLQDLCSIPAYVFCCIFYIIF